jgi:hypothetical protein
MKGTIRERRMKDGTDVLPTKVEASRDPATKANKRRYRTATATTRREANTLLHTMMAEVDETKTSGTDATILTLGELIERWLELGPRQPRPGWFTTDTSRIRSAHTFGIPGSINYGLPTWTDGT